MGEGAAARSETASLDEIGALDWRSGLEPCPGAILWQGCDIRYGREQHGQRVRYLSHQEGLKPVLTVAETLAFAARLYGATAGAEQRALTVMALESLAELPVRLLSAGQRRRLALARLALAPAPLWLLDEPSVGLDAAALARLGDLLAVHRAAGGMVVATTHVPLPLPAAAELWL